MNQIKSESSNKALNQNWKYSTYYTAKLVLFYCIE